MLTRMPRGYPDTHPAATLLRHQSFTVGRELSDTEVLGPRLPDVLAREYARILPLVRWLNERGVRAERFATRFEGEEGSAATEVPDEAPAAA